MRTCVPEVGISEIDKNTICGKYAIMYALDVCFLHSSIRITNGISGSSQHWIDIPDCKTSRVSDSLEYQSDIL